MFSFKSSRSKAYSSDIRWRMVHQRCSLGLTYTQIATNLNVDPSTVCRTVQLFEQTGTVESIQGYHEKTTKKLSSTDELVLMEAIVKQPSIYLHELQNILLQTTGTTICLTAIHKFLAFQGFSHKKFSHRALQRSDQLRDKFISEISIYESHMLVFVDETGSDRRTALHRYSYRKVWLTSACAYHSRW